ncbi:MAG: O-antigen ligase family protein [Chloroflexi bacterium]|nr:O-antigen ligase family protein [Chloroflexota bacterium]
MTVDGAALRRWLALGRLAQLFILFCFLLFAFGLEGRAVKENDGAAFSSRLATGAPAAQIPLLGINVALEQLNPGERRAALARLKASNFGWVRQRFDWQQLEPTSGQSDWRQADDLLHEIVDANLIPVVLLDGSPAWARSGQDTGENDNAFAPPAEAATFARFAAAFARRYGAQVRFYQLWDEPNLAPHWGNRHIDPVSYAQLLKMAASAIRSADPDAVIITAALAPTADRGHTAIDEVYFLQRLYAAGAAPYFDAVAVEPFGFGSAPGDARTQIDLLNFQRIKLVRNVMLAANDGEKPVWAVRYGWNTRYDSPWGTVTPTDQLRFAVQAQTLARQQWPWLATLGWMIDQPARPAADPLWGFALTPGLAQALGQSAVMPVALNPAAPVSTNALLYGWFLVALAAVLGWRSIAAARLLPWQTWRHRYRAWSPMRQILLWGLLLIVYAFSTWPPLILLCCLFASSLLIVQPQVGLWLAALLLPFYFQHKELHLLNTSWAIAPAHAVLLCLLPALLWRLWQMTLAGQQANQLRQPLAAWRLGGKNIQWQGLDWLALSWLVISLLSGVKVWPGSAYWHGLFELVLMPLLLYATVRLLVTTSQQWQAVIYALFAGGLAASVIGLFGWWQGSGTEVDGVLRLVGPYYSANHMALYLVRSLFLGVGLAWLTTGHWRRIWFAACTVMAGALLLTASRGALLLGVPIGAFCFGFAFLQPRRARLQPLKLRVPWLLTLLMLIVVVLGVVLFWQRLTNLTTASQRLVTWQAAWQMWRDYPWFGVGPGGFFWHYPAYLHGLIVEPDLEHPHNVWLEFATGWGTAGLLWLAALIVTLIKCLRRLDRHARLYWLQIGLLAGLVAGFAHGQVDAFGALADLAAWNWLALALWVQQNKILRAY